MTKKQLPPILSHKRYTDPSLFEPEKLIREASRQKGLPSGAIPAFCVLDPDGDIVRNLRAGGRAQRNPHWACYHTDLYSYREKCCGEEVEIGVVGCAVGASFAVLVAEQMFASGCEFLLSITSSGQITAKQKPPYFVCIDRALRDEGTSYHYLPPTDYVSLPADVAAHFKESFRELAIPVFWGATWTTDAPYRETAAAVDFACKQQILAVEMEAAALYAFAQARQKNVLCFAHVTNFVANVEGDFEKGEAQGSHDALALIKHVAERRHCTDRHV